MISLVQCPDGVLYRGTLPWGPGFAEAWMSSSAGTSFPKPRVLFLVHRFPPVFGGGARFLGRVRDRLLDEGSESIVVTGDRGIPGGDQPGVYRLPFPSGGSFPRLGAYSFALMAFPVLVALRRKYDLIQTGGNAHYAYVAILAGLLLGKPVVIRSTLNRADDPTGILRQRFGRLRNAIFSRASAFVCCSGLQVEAYRNAGYPMRKVHFIPNGSDPDRFSPCAGPEEKAELRERLGLPRDPFTVVTVGVVSERKGIDFLAEAWIDFLKMGRRGQLLLVGPDSTTGRGGGVDGGFVESVRARLREAGVTDSVRFMGRVSNVEEYLRAADVFALMSRGEGFPTAILEAMSCGLPFVIWDLPDYAGYGLRDGEHGFLLPPFDVARLSRCLADLEASPQRVEALGRQARLLGSRFTIASSLAQHVALYREIAALRPSGRGASSPSRR